MDSQKPPQKTGINPIWWVIMLGLLAWNIYAFWPRSQEAIPLPYSSFISQVKADHVQSVSISGSAIKGQFTQPQLLSDLIPATTPTPATSLPGRSEAVT